jgi:hypothetical protein
MGIYIWTVILPIQHHIVTLTPLTKLSLSHLLRHGYPLYSRHSSARASRPVARSALRTHVSLIEARAKFLEKINVMGRWGENFPYIYPSPPISQMSRRRSPRYQRWMIDPAIRSDGRVRLADVHALAESGVDRSWTPFAVLRHAHHAVPKYRCCRWHDHFQSPSSPNDRKRLVHLPQAANMATGTQRRPALRASPVIRPIGRSSI